MLLSKLTTKYRFTKSIIFRFTTILLLLVMTPFTILLANASSELRNTERERAAEFLYSNLQIISSTTDSLLGSVEAVQTEMLLNTQFTSAVRHLSSYDERDEYADFKAVQTIKRVLAEASVRSDEIESVYLYCADAHRVFVSNANYSPQYNDYRAEGSVWYRSYANNTEQTPWNITTALDSADTLLSCYRIIEEYGKPLSGLFSINMTPDVILDTVREANLGQSSIYFVVDSYGNVLKEPLAAESSIAHVKNAVPKGGMGGSFNLAYEGKELFVSYLKSGYSDLTYVVFAPLNEIQTSAGRLNWLLGWFIALSILVLLLCTILVYFYFYHPIRNLANGMKRFETGDFSVRMPTKRSDEIGLINRQFNDMTDNIDTLIRENYINELAKRDIQLRYTQNQINEHFLYNTLDSIHWLARRHGVDEIAKMIQALANFYRTSLSSGKDIIHAGQVERMIGDYLYIQSMRLGETFTYSCDFDLGLADIDVPKDVFLPLVENAIVHGINGREKGHVSVLLTEEKGFMRFSVKDDGNGIDSVRLWEIRRHLASDEIRIEDSFALRTVNKQLSLFFDASDGIHIKTALGKGTTVWFDMPFQTKEYPCKGDASND
ncbi:MAG: sensor histidine kinase [Clostridiales Family XIII bacterium]|nr:sensor histidine kinase [Clostridiales Family XIII bacterium]